MTSVFSKSGNNPNLKVEIATEASLIQPMKAGFNVLNL